MADVRGVAKASKNAHGGYLYAGHEAVTDALRDAYVKHGIVRSATVLEHTRDGGLLRLLVEVSWINVGEPSDRHVVQQLGESPAVTKTGVAAPQQSGIALSYAVKLAEFKTLALTGDDTPDGASPEAQARDVPPDPPVDVEGYLAEFGLCTGADELRQVTESVRKVAGRLTEQERETLRDAAQAAKKRIGA